MRDIFQTNLSTNPTDCLNGEIITEAHTAYSTFRRLLVYFRTKWETWKHIHDQRKYSWYFLVQRKTKLIISKPCIKQNHEISYKGNFRGYLTYSREILKSTTMINCVTSNGQEAWRHIAYWTKPIYRYSFSNKCFLNAHLRSIILG